MFLCSMSSAPPNRVLRLATVAVLAVCLVVCKGCLTATPQQHAMGAKNFSRANLTDIGVALAKYREVHGTLPSGIEKVALSGQERLSWRVHLLPFLGVEEKKLYGKFRTNEAWDSAYNLKLLNHMPMVYESAEHPRSKIRPASDRTCFLAAEGVVATRVLSSATTSDDSQHVLVVEADNKNAVPWTSPDDWKADELIRAPRISGRHDGKYFVLDDNFRVELIQLRRVIHDESQVPGRSGLPARPR